MTCYAYAYTSLKNNIITACHDFIIQYTFFHITAYIQNEKQVKYVYQMFVKHFFHIMLIELNLILTMINNISILPC